jgi:hypothetical protein
MFDPHFPHFVKLNSDFYKNDRISLVLTALRHKASNQDDLKIEMLKEGGKFFIVRLSISICVFYVTVINSVIY